MPIHYEPHISRAMLRAEPDTLWVFADNLMQLGSSGQAGQMRGEPNAIGIPTRRAPYSGPEGEFSDRDMVEFVCVAAEPFGILNAHLAAGGLVVWPAEGIGTSRAHMEHRAPRIWAALQRAMRKLETTAEADDADAPV